MQRKPGFPVLNCSIKLPDSMMPEVSTQEEENEHQQKRQQLINFGHMQWGNNNWNWAVTKQELDFVELVNGKYCAGVVAFVSVSVKSVDLHRENIGYATSTAGNKGFAIYKSRKCAVTNALRETLLSFGGSIATDLMDLLESNKKDVPVPVPAVANPVLPPAPPAPCELENNQNVNNKVSEPKNAPKNIRKDSDLAHNMRPIPPPVKNIPQQPPPSQPLSAALPPAPRPPAPPHPRPNSNETSAAGAGEGCAGDEEARAERRRRQRLAQEHFRQKQCMKQQNNDDKHEMNENANNLDRMLLEIPTQDIVGEENRSPRGAGSLKRVSPVHCSNISAKRRASFSELDILHSD